MAATAALVLRLSNKTRKDTYLVLAGAQLVHEQGAALGVLPAVEAVQLQSHFVKLVIGEEELGEQRCVRSLKLKKNITKLISPKEAP